MAQDNQQDHHPHPETATGGELLPPGPAKPNSLTTSCHCGRINVEMPSPPLKVNECRCSVCYRYGAIWAYFPRAGVNVYVNITWEGPEREDTPRSRSRLLVSSPQEEAQSSGLRGYVREDRDGDGSIGFYFCDHCGCMTHWALTKKGIACEQDVAEIGVNCRMLPPRLLEGVKWESGAEGDF